jgi:1,4-alpha-glucan branching enzyme
MSGDEWQKFANLRALLGDMYAQPGKKLLFMGAELGQWGEWNHERSLDWHLLDYPLHTGIQRWVHDLNQTYRREPALHQLDFTAEGFAWIDCNDALQSTISLLRRGRSKSDVLLVACNFTPIPRHNYRVGAPHAGFWQEILNSDSHYYGGSGQGSLGAVEAAPVPSHRLPYSLNLTLPPLAAVFFKQEVAEK